MRHLLVIAGLALLTACSSQADGLPNWITGFPGEGPSFGVATLLQAPTAAGYAGFSKASPDLFTIHADQLCTLGWQNLGEETLPGEQVPITQTTMRCNAYRPSF